MKPSSLQRYAFLARGENGGIFNGSTSFESRTFREFIKRLVGTEETVGLGDL